MKKILIGALAAGVLMVAGLLIYASTLPDEWKVEESVVVDAAPAAVYDTVADLKTWNEWTMWGTERDPTLENTYEGAEKGEGAVWTWSGEEMGKGRLEYTEAVPNEKLEYELEFVDMDSSSHGTITFEKVDEGTKVTWTDGGSMGFVGRLMIPMIEESIAKEFRSSLDNLDEAVKKGEGS